MSSPDLVPGSTGSVRTADGLRLHYEVHGAGTQTLLVPLACWTLPDLAAILPGIRVVGYDPRGRGRSDGVGADSRLGVEVDVDDLGRLVAELDLGRAALMGWAYYGAVAAWYAARHPIEVSSVALISPLPLRRVPHFGRAAQEVAERIDADAMAALGVDARRGSHTADPERFCRRWNRALEPAYTASVGALSRMRANPCGYRNEHPAAVNTLLARIWQVLGDWDWRRDLWSVPAPMLVLWGERDFQPRAAVEEWAELPAAELVVLEEAGHLAWLDRPDAVGDALRRFLDRSFGG